MAQFHFSFENMETWSSRLTTGRSASTASSSASTASSSASSPNLTNDTCKPNTTNIIVSYSNQFTDFSIQNHTVYDANGSLVGNWADSHPMMFVYPPLSRGVQHNGDYKSQGNMGMRKNFNRFGVTCVDGCSWGKCKAKTAYGGGYRMLLWRAPKSSAPDEWRKLSLYHSDMPAECIMSSSWADGDVPKFRKQSYWTTTGERVIGGTNGVKCTLSQSISPSDEKTRLRFKANVSDTNWLNSVTIDNRSPDERICIGLTDECFTTLKDVISLNNNSKGKPILGFETNAKIPDYGDLSSNVHTPTTMSMTAQKTTGAIGISVPTYKSPIMTNTSVTISTEHVPDYLQAMDSTKHTAIQFIKDFIDQADTIPSKYHSGTFAKALNGIILNLPELTAKTVNNSKMWFRNAFNEAVHACLNGKNNISKVKDCFISNSKLIEFEIGTGLLPCIAEQMGIKTELASASVDTEFFIDEQYGSGSKSVLRWRQRPIFKHVVNGFDASGMPSSKTSYEDCQLYIDGDMKTFSSSSMTVKQMSDVYLPEKRSPGDDDDDVIAIRNECNAGSETFQGTKLFRGTYRVYLDSNGESKNEKSSYLNGVTQGLTVESCCGNHNQGSGYSTKTNTVFIGIHIGTMVEIPYTYCAFDLSKIESNIDAIVKGFYDQSGVTYRTSSYTKINGTNYAWSWSTDTDTNRFVTGCRNNKIFIPNSGPTKKDIILYRVLGANMNMGKVCGPQDNAGGDCACTTNESKDGIGNNWWVADSTTPKAFCHADTKYDAWFDDLIVPNDQLNKYGTMRDCGLGYFLIDETETKTTETDVVVHKDGNKKYIELKFEFKVDFYKKTPPQNVTAKGLCPYFVKHPCYFITPAMYRRWLNGIGNTFCSNFVDVIKSCLTPSCLVMYHAYNRLLGLEPMCLYENPFNAVMIHNAHNVGSGHNAYYSDYIMSTENGVPFSGEVDNKFGNYLDTIAKDAVNDMAIKGPRDDVAIVVHLPTDAKELTKITKCELSLFSDLSAKSRLIYVTELERNSEKYENAPAINLVDTNRGNVNNVLILTPTLINTSGNSANQALQLASLGAITVPRFIVDSDTNKKTKTFTFDSVLMNIYMTNNPAVNPKPEWNKATNKASNRYLELHFDTSKTQDELKYIKGKELKSEFE